MRERDIESKLRDAVKAVGGLCWKFTSVLDDKKDIAELVHKIGSDDP